MTSQANSKHQAGYVAVIGRPNAGKSTLLNRILDSELSIVTPKAQTTRDRIQGILTEPNRGQIILTDTPGIHQAKVGGVNSVWVREAQQATRDADVVWYLVDPNSGLNHEAVVLETLKGVKAPVFLLINKSDRPHVSTLWLQSLKKELENQGTQIQKVVEISALKGSRIDEVLEATWSHIPEGPAFFPDTEQLSDRPLRFFVSEKIREELFLKLGDEIPYSCAVRIESFDEKVKPIRIEATIIVERDSQKGMVVGAQGKKIKAIGQGARIKIEKMVGQKIFLGLMVKVMKNWTRNAIMMKELGYDPVSKSE